MIVRFDGGDLWVWSPIKLSAGLHGEISALGRVRHLVSPNKLHHLYLSDWRTLYPDARLWGPLSTVKKRRDLDFFAPLDDTPPQQWRPYIDQAWFRGSPLRDEIVFFHRPSRTVLATDLIQNFSDAFLRTHWRRWQRLLAKMDGIGESDAYAPLEWRLSFINRRPARVARAKVMAWDCRRAIMAHGQIVRFDGHAFLEKALAWLGR